MERTKCPIFEDVEFNIKRDEETLIYDCYYKRVEDNYGICSFHSKFKCALKLKDDNSSYHVEESFFNEPQERVGFRNSFRNLWRNDR